MTAHYCTIPRRREASSSDLPGSMTERAAPPPLFGLAPRGVCPAGRITPSAVRSCRTFSPLPRSLAVPGRYILCGTFRKDPFERSLPAVSRHVTLWRPDFPPACASGYPSGACQFQFRMGRVRTPSKNSRGSCFCWTDRRSIRGPEDRPPERVSGV